jgi:glyoxylase I family protein
MTLQGIHHSGIVVSDLDRSLYFYHDVLGLPFAIEPTPWNNGPSLEAGIRVPGARVRQASLWVGQHSTLELIEHANRPGPRNGPVPNNYLGAGHVAFRVDDIWGTKAELEARGVEFYTDVNVVEDGPLAGWRWVYFSDPDGMALELVELEHYDKTARDEAACSYLSTRPSLELLQTRAK